MSLFSLLPYRTNEITNKCGSQNYLEKFREKVFNSATIFEAKGKGNFPFAQKVSA